MDGSMIPKWLEKSLTPKAFQEIEQAIKNAESKTSGEIVPIIVRSSSTVGHIPTLLTLLLYALYLSLFSQFEFLSNSEWYVSPIIFLALYFLSGALSTLPTIQRILTPNDDQGQQVSMRAEIEFYQRKLNHTDGATGILLFVSMMEHRAVVLADKSISEKMPPETWNEVIQILTTGIRTKDLSNGMCLAIQRCGDILQEKFPIQPNDKNELVDHLVIKE